MSECQSKPFCDDRADELESLRRYAVTQTDLLLRSRAMIRNLSAGEGVLMADFDALLDDIAASLAKNAIPTGTKCTPVDACSICDAIPSTPGPHHGKACDQWTEGPATSSPEIRDADGLRARDERLAEQSLVTLGEEVDQRGDSERVVRNKRCVWTLDERHFMYDTACGNAFQFNHGGLRDNNVTFCGYCGGKIVADESPRTSTTGVTNHFKDPS